MRNVSINFMIFYNLIKKVLSILTITTYFLQSCTNVNSVNGMQNEVESPKNRNETGKILAFIGIGATIGAAIVTAVVVPVYNGYLSNQASQLYSDISVTQSQSTLLASALIPTLAENKNAIYSLANGTSITGNSNNIASLSYSDILGITAMNLTSNNTIYTAEEEFNFVSLSQILPSLNGLESINIINQYFPNSIDLSTTSLNSINLSGSYLNGIITFPKKLSSAILNNTMKCSGGVIVCNGGNILNTNCNDDKINTLFNNYNNQAISTLCNDLSIYQSLLTNYTTLYSAYQMLGAYLYNGGLQACVDCTNAMNSLNQTYLNLNDTYTTLNNNNNICNSNYQNIIASCSSCNGTLTTMTTNYNNCSSNGLYPNAATQYSTCSTNLPSMNTSYLQCSNNGSSPNAGNLYSTCSGGGAISTCSSSSPSIISNLTQICNTMVICDVVCSTSCMQSAPLSSCGIGGSSSYVNGVGPNTIKSIGNTYSC